MIAKSPDGRANNAIEPRYGMDDLWSEGTTGVCDGEVPVLVRGVLVR